MKQLMLMILLSSPVMAQSYEDYEQEYAREEAIREVESQREQMEMRYRKAEEDREQYEIDRRFYETQSLQNQRDLRDNQEDALKEMKRHNWEMENNW